MKEQVKFSTFFHNEETIIKFHNFFNNFEITNNKNINYIWFSGSKLIKLSLIEDLIKWNEIINNTKYFYFKYDIEKYCNLKKMVINIFNDLFIKMKNTNNDFTLSQIPIDFNKMINIMNKKWLNTNLKIIIFIENFDTKIDLFNDFKKNFELFTLLISCQIILVIIWNDNNKNFKLSNSNNIKCTTHANITKFLDMDKTINFLLLNEKNYIISEFISILSKNNNKHVIVESLFLLKKLKIKYNEKFTNFINKLNHIESKKKMIAIIDSLIFYIIYTKQSSQFNYKNFLYNFRNKILIERKLKEMIIEYQLTNNDSEITYNNIILSNKEKCILPLAIYNSFFGNVFSGYLQKEKGFYYYVIGSFKPYNRFCLLIIKLKINDFFKKILINNKNIYEEILELLFNTTLKDEKFFI